MTVRQVIQEIEALLPEEQQQVLLHFDEKKKDANGVRYLDADAARPMIREILSEHSELFRKLAQ